MTKDEIECENECGGAFKGSEKCEGCIYRKTKTGGNMIGVIIAFLLGGVIGGLVGAFVLPNLWKPKA